MCRDDSAEEACLFSVCDLFDYRGNCPNTKRVGTAYKMGSLAGFRLVRSPGQTDQGSNYMSPGARAKELVPASANFLGSRPSE